MKPIVLTLLILSCFCRLHAQGEEPEFQNYPYVDITGENFKVKGYVNGIRLDSLSAVYAFVTRRSLGFMDVANFDYGLTIKRKDNPLFIQTANGAYCNFNSMIALLNFLAYNGWVLKQYVVRYNADRDELLMEKKVNY